MNKIDVSRRIIRWLLLLQEFDLTIIDKPRKHNVVVDFLSRLARMAQQGNVEDLFPNEHMFVE